MRVVLAVLAVGAGVTLLAGCVGQVENRSGDSPDLLDPDDPSPTEVIEPSDDVTPFDWLALASNEVTVREVPLYAQNLDDLQTNPELDDLRQVLASAGWSTEESAGLITAAAGYNSGGEHDDVRARNLDSSEEIAVAFADFEKELTLAEEEAGVTIDRDQLFGTYFGAEAVE